VKTHTVINDESLEALMLRILIDPTYFNNLNPSEGEDLNQTLLTIRLDDMVRYAHLINSQVNVLDRMTHDPDLHRWYLRPYEDSTAMFELVVIGSDLIHYRVYPDSELRAKVDAVYGRYVSWDDEECVYVQRGNIMVDQIIKSKLRYVQGLVASMQRRKDN
jgi:hypothetical protein